MFVNENIPPHIQSFIYRNYKINELKFLLVKKGRVISLIFFILCKFITISFILRSFSCKSEKKSMKLYVIFSLFKAFDF